MTCSHCGVAWVEHETGSQLCYDARAHDRIAELAKELARLSVLLGELEDANCETQKHAVTRVLEQWRGGKNG